MLHVVQCCDGIASLLPKKADSDRARAELKGCHHRIYYFGNHFQKQ